MLTFLLICGVPLWQALPISLAFYGLAFGLLEGQR